MPPPPAPGGASRRWRTCESCGRLPCPFWLHETRCVSIARVWRCRYSDVIHGRWRFSMNTKVLTRAMLGVAALAIAIPTIAGTTKARYGAFGIDLTTQDKTVKPGDDFW